MDTDVDRARWRGTLNVRVLRNLQLGAEFNLAATEIGPLLTWFLTTEASRRPAAFLGTSSDRIGSPEGKQAYYLTLAKHAPKLPVSAYVSLNYSEWDEQINVPFGVTLSVGTGVSVQTMYDGDRTHLLVHYTATRVAVAGLWVWLEQPGVSISVGF